MKMDLVIAYVKARLTEMSTLDGAVIAAAGVAFILFQPIAIYVAYAAVAYGVYRMVTVG